MADTLSRNVQALQEALRSKSPHRASHAAQLSSDLYQLCIESVSDTELGACAYSFAPAIDNTVCTYNLWAGNFCVGVDAMWRVW